MRPCYRCNYDLFEIVQDYEVKIVIDKHIVYITRIFPIMPRRSEIVYRHIIIS